MRGKDGVPLALAARQQGSRAPAPVETPGSVVVGSLSPRAGTPLACTGLTGWLPSHQPEAGGRASGAGAVLPHPEILHFLSEECE